MCVASLSNGSFSYEKLPSEPSPPNSDENNPPPPTNPRASHVVGACLFVALLLIIAGAILAVVIFNVYEFYRPAYRVTKLSVHGANQTWSPPGFDVTITVTNFNDKLGIHYFKPSAVSVFYDDLCLGSGVLPDFYQPKKNTTVLQAALAGSDEFVHGAAETALRNDERLGRVLLTVIIEAPYKLQVGSFKLSEDTVTDANCVVLDRFDEKATIISHYCHRYRH